MCPPPLQQVYGLKISSVTIPVGEEYYRQTWSNIGGQTSTGIRRGERLASNSLRMVWQTEEEKIDMGKRKLPPPLQRREDERALPTLKARPKKYPPSLYSRTVRTDLTIVIDPRASREGSEFLSDPFPSPYTRDETPKAPYRRIAWVGNSSEPSTSCLCVSKCLRINVSQLFRYLFRGWFLRQSRCEGCMICASLCTFADQPSLSRLLFLLAFIFCCGRCGGWSFSEVSFSLSSKIVQD